MTGSHLKRLHPDDMEYWLAVERATWRLAVDQKIRLKIVRPIDPKADFYGQADCVGRWMEISLRYSGIPKKNWGPRREPAYVLDTICHELAHLATPYERDHHGPIFMRTFSRLIARQEDLKLRVDLWRNAK